MIAFVAVLREGVELALFLTAASFSAKMQSMLLGAFLGLGIAIVFGIVLFRTAVHINIKRFFQITSMILLLFSAGLVGHAVSEFTEIGWIPPLIHQIWDSNPLISENSVVGTLLRSLFGYNAQPSLVEIMAYLTYLTGIGIGLWRVNMFYTQNRREIQVE